MAAKIDEALLKRLEEVEKHEQQDHIRVIVTFRARAGIAALEKKGLKIQQAFESIPAASATLTASEIRKLARSDEVEIVEQDGEMHALRD